ncbi:MAG: DMT family transporter [Melioribacteraceae bacterium]|nr:MAG: DMT family transporter [Melioribacteraceae bacterium]
MNSTEPTGRKYLAEGALLLATLIWGGTFVIVKESLNDSSPMLFITLRFALASILLLPFIYKRRKLFTKELLFGSMLVGVFLFLGFATQTVGLKYTTASRSGFITGTTVVIVPILQLLIEKRPPTLGAIIGTLLVFLGLTFLSSGGNSIYTVFTELGTNFNWGDFLTLLCAVFFAFQIVFIDIVSRKYDFWLLMFVQLSTVAVLAFFATLFFEITSIESIKLIPTDYLLFGLLYTGILATLINISIQTKFQKEVTPTKAGIIFSFELVFAALFAFFLLNEKITNFGIVGGALIFMGLLVSEAYDTFKLIYEQRIKKS